ncbi:hypothetical protein ID866_13349 [Astraeus odoratus]|nr:hypothetical protein ID866_13349 [Astraeus odoratus]
MHLNTAHEMFQQLTKMFKNHSHIIPAQLHHQLHSTMCPEKGNVHEHFDKLWLLHEQLASLGHRLNDDTFTPIITTSLPPSYNAQVGSIMTLAKLAGKTLTSDNVLTAVKDEYDCHTIKKQEVSNHQ